MSNIEALHINASGTQKVLSKDQKRFNSLLKQIDKARATLRAWQEQAGQFQRAYDQALPPLTRQWRDARRQWIFALHGMQTSKGWTPAERATMRELLRDAITDLLMDDDSDDRLQALFAEYSDTDFNSHRQEMLHAVKDMAESVTGLDLGDADGITDQDELMRRVHEQMAQRMQQEELAEEQARQAEQQRPSRAARRARPKSAAQQRREEQAQQALQSVREIRRRLASALHPDRESDPALRAEKTALMQQVNQAYENNDLLTLLELQLRIEQIDAEHMTQAAPERIRHYNKVLAEQFDELRAQILQAEMGFREQYDIDFDTRLDPNRLDKLLQECLRDLRQSEALLHQQMKLWANAAATRRWLRNERQRLRDAERMEEGFSFFY